MKPRHDIAFEIRDVKESLSELTNRGESYGLRPFEQGVRSMATGVDATDYVRMRLLFIEKEELISVELTSRELVKKLVGRPSTRLVHDFHGWQRRDW